jgi:soluble lytic murein transglycosylase-like protein
MKAKASVFLVAWLISGSLFAGLIIRKDEKGHIVLSNTMDSGGQKKDSFTFLSSSHSIAIPLPYKDKIQSLTQKHSLREDLVIAVAKVESGFDAFAVSRKGAVGIMQLMKETAWQYGVFNRYNVSENLEAGIKHLKYLYDKFKGNIPLTLAAYNAGEESVNKYNGVPPYPETKQYIRRVMSLLGMSDSFSTSSRVKTRIYKYVTPAGRIVITDTMPTDINGSIEIIL